MSVRQVSFILANALASSSLAHGASMSLLRRGNVCTGEKGEADFVMVYNQAREKNRIFVPQRSPLSALSELIEIQLFTK